MVLGVERVEVDEGIAALVRALWRAGFRTVSSCENMGEAYSDLPPVAMVGFAETAQAERFARLAGGRIVETEPVDLTPEKRAADNAPPGTVAVCFADIGGALAKVEALA